MYFAPFIQQYLQHFFQDRQPLSISFHNILLSEIKKFIHSFKKHFIMFHNIHHMPQQIPQHSSINFNNIFL